MIEDPNLGRFAEKSLTCWRLPPTKKEKEFHLKTMVDGFANLITLVVTLNTSGSLIMLGAIRLKG